MVRVQSDADGAVWQRQVERPYPGVPRPDDWVFLGEDDEGNGLAATPIAVVTWENDGAITVQFELAAAGADAANYLEQLGFTRA